MKTETKYVLHGGKAQHPNGENDKFFAEILNNTSENVRILLVHFASEPEKNETNRDKDIAQFERIKNNKTLIYDEAEESIFTKQILAADVIYFGGGTTIRLLDNMKKFKDLKKVFQGKIIAGESAGANFLAEYCYSKPGGGVIKCLGIIPFKIIPHYSEQFKNAKEELDNIPGDFETLVLPEYKYVVFVA